MDDGAAQGEVGGGDDSLTAAASLIGILDDACADMTDQVLSAQEEADGARRNAAAAAEVARRYGARSYPGGTAGEGGGGGGGDSSAGAGSGGALASASASVRAPSPADRADGIRPTPYDYALPYDRLTVSPDRGSEGWAGDSGPPGEGGGDGRGGGGEGSADGGPLDAIRGGNDDEDGDGDLATAMGSTSMDDFRSLPPEEEGESEEEYGLGLGDDGDEAQASGMVGGKEEGGSEDEYGQDSSDKAQDSGMVGEKEQGGTSERPPSLPPGWVDAFDGASGVPYYYREADGYTTWERPLPEQQQGRGDGDGDGDGADEPQSRQEDAHGTAEERGGATPSRAGAGGRFSSPGAMSPARTVAARVRQSHAEDVLALSLELERAREAAERGKSQSEAVRAELAEARSVRAGLEEEARVLREGAEQLAASHGEECAALREELRRAQARAAAAEEDANLALDLARGSAESREQLEGWLQRALDEIEMLREHLTDSGVAAPRPESSPRQPPPSPELSVGSPLPPIAEEVAPVHKEEQPTSPVLPRVLAPDGSIGMMSHSTTRTTTTTVTTTASAGYAPPPPVDSPASTPRGKPPQPHASREMVAAGRDVLRRASSGPSTPTWQRLRDKLDADHALMRKRALVPVSGKGRQTFSTADEGSIDSVLAKRLMVVLSDSGTKLGLGGPQRKQGRWGVSASSSKEKRDDDFHGYGEADDINNFESLVVDYCSSVEAKMEKAKEEIHELQAFTEYLESKVVAA